MSVFKIQYDELRAEKTAGAKNPLLLIELGNFYEAFFDDARIICTELCITETRREDKSHVILDAPHLPEYIKKLEAAGYTPIIAREERRKSEEYRAANNKRHH